MGTAISLAFILEKDTRHRLRWNHIREALRNYSFTKGVEEYATGDVEGEGEVERGHAVLYNRLKSDYSGTSIFFSLQGTRS